MKKRLSQENPSPSESSADDSSLSLWKQQATELFSRKCDEACGKDSLNSLSLLAELFFSFSGMASLSALNMSRQLGKHVEPVRKPELRGLEGRLRAYAELERGDPGLAELSGCRDSNMKRLLATLWKSLLLCVHGT